MTEKEFSNIHDQVWQLLPWYLNQTLSPDEDTMVATHLSVCLVCRNELSHQQALKQAVITDHCEDTAVKRSLNSLHQRIQEHYTRPQPSWRGWLNDVFSIVRESHFGIQTALATQAAVIMLAIVFFLGDIRPQPEEYQTLTSEPAAVVTSEQVFTVIFAENLTIIGLQQLLEDYAMSIKSGPSPAGAYVLTVNEASQSGPEASSKLLSKLQDHPKIRFAAVASSQ